MTVSVKTNNKPIAAIFIFLGLALIAGYQIYWMRVIVPERNNLTTAISVSPDTVDRRNDGKLIHVTGPLAGAENLADPEFNVTANALRLRRRVWMYQWQESAGRPSTSSYGTEDTHGKTTAYLKTQSYNYSKVWSEKVINSRLFRPDRASVSAPGTSIQMNAAVSLHENPPTKAVPDRTVAAAKITLDAFTVAPELVEQIDNFQPVPVTDSNLAAIRAPLRAQAKLLGGEIYLGANADQPAIGDLKVKFESAPPTAASVIARQNGNSVSPYPTANGGTVALLRTGTHSIQEMAAQLAKTESQRRMLVWVMGSVPILLGILLIKATPGK